VPTGEHFEVTVASPGGAADGHAIDDELEDVPGCKGATVGVPLQR
jgi:hypothetical protein